MAQESANINSAWVRRPHFFPPPFLRLSSCFSVYRIINASRCPQTQTFGTFQLPPGPGIREVSSLSSLSYMHVLCFSKGP